MAYSLPFFRHEIFFKFSLEYLAVSDVSLINILENSLLDYFVYSKFGIKTTLAYCDNPLPPVSYIALELRLNVCNKNFLQKVTRQIYSRYATCAMSSSSYKSSRSTQHQ